MAKKALINKANKTPKFKVRAYTRCQRCGRPHSVYRKSKEIPRVLGGLGVAVVSTSQGLLTDREARKRNVGGEILCFVW